MKIAFVYDRVNKFGGAERVLLALHEIWPQAPLYTAVYNRQMSSWSDVFQINTSFLRYLPFSASKHELFTLFMSHAFESFNFDEYDIVLSLTSADAKCIITKPGTLHICYCLTPTRYLWSGYRDYINEPGEGILNPIIRFAFRLFSNRLRLWDFISSARVDHFIAISKTVAKRIKRYYRRESDIIYPPVDTDKFKPKNTSEQTKEKYFLIVSRLVPYKKIDYVIRVFNKMKIQLKIIGKGIDENRLKEMASSNVEFIGGDLTEEKLCCYHQNCTALIFPGEEDFGIAAVEAQACGKPVIGYANGGVGEIVISGITGELYKNQNEADLVKIISEFKPEKYSKEACRTNALKFSKSKFQKNIKSKINNYWRIFNNSNCHSRLDRESIPSV